MACFNYGNKSDCAGFAIVVSIIIGIITAFLTYTAVITVTPAFLWVLFGIAVVYLAITFVTLYTRGNNNYPGCAYSTVPVLLIGILGTILTAIILLGISFAATSVVGAIITGFLLLFFSLTITATACLVRCAVRNNNNNDD